MPEMFTQQFAERLDDLCTITVKEAKDGDKKKPKKVTAASKKKGAETRVKKVIDAFKALDKTYL